MSTMYCQCEVNSLTTSGTSLIVSIVPVGTFRLSFWHDDKRIEYAAFSDNKDLSTSGKDTDGRLLSLGDGKLEVEFPDANTKTIESSMLIAAATAKSRILVGVNDTTTKPIKIISVELC